MKCIVTRDDNGWIIFWPLNVKGLRRKYGDWRATSKSIVLVTNDCIKGVCKLLGFTPSKGSKQLIDIPKVKVKKLQS